MFGLIFALAGGLIAFINVNSFPVVAASVVLKAIGIVPAQFVLLALISDVLDRLEEKNGFRSDGFTMSLYSSVMVGLGGLGTGLINGMLTFSGYSNVGYAVDPAANTLIADLATWTGPVVYQQLGGTGAVLALAYGAPPLVLQAVVLNVVVSHGSLRLCHLYQSPSQLVGSLQVLLPVLVAVTALLLLREQCKVIARVVGKLVGVEGVQRLGIAVDSLHNLGVRRLEQHGVVNLLRHLFGAIHGEYHAGGNNLVAQHLLNPVLVVVSADGKHHALHERAHHARGIAIIDRRAEHQHISLAAALQHSALSNDRFSSLGRHSSNSLGRQWGWGNLLHNKQ